MTFKYGTGGALICDEEIAGVTQQLDKDAAKYYGGNFMVGESMVIGAARRIAELLGGSLEESASDLDLRKEVAA
jgi:hypothetical protein